MARPAIHRKQIGIVAGEASGDLLGAHLIDALRRDHPDLEFFGIAGPKMQAQGATSLFPMEKLSVRGYWEVLRHYSEIRGIQRKLIDVLGARRPPLYIGVDAPDFNLPVERALRELGVTTVHYVSPSIWAWRGARIEKIKRAASHVLTLFPFEPEIYANAGVPATFTGHPMADLIPRQVDRRAARERLGLRAEDAAVVLMPGSRVSELQYHGELFAAAARLVAERQPRCRFFAPSATEQTQGMFRHALDRAGARALEVRLRVGGTAEVLAAADVALIASGTATLEAALWKCPMVICYKLSRISAWLMGRMAYLPYVGLPNILANELIVPEILQERATPEALAAAMLDLLQSAEIRQRMLARFDAIHRALAQDSAKKLAQAFAPYLSSSEAHAGGT